MDLVKKYKIHKINAHVNKFTEGLNHELNQLKKIRNFQIHSQIILKKTSYSF